MLAAPSRLTTQAVRCAGRDMLWTFWCVPHRPDGLHCANRHRAGNDEVASSRRTTQGCALGDIERYAELRRDEGLDACKPRRLDQLELPGEAGIRDNAHDGVDACAAGAELWRRSLCVIDDGLTTSGA